MAERGQPTKYEHRYCDEVVAFGEEGGTLAMFAVKIKVARSTLIEWAAANPEFSVAVTRAKEARLTWLQQHVNRLITEGDRDSNASARMLEFALSKEFREDYGDAPVNIENAVPTVIQIKLLKRGDED